MIRPEGEMGSSHLYGRHSHRGRVRVHRGLGAVRPISIYLSCPSRVSVSRLLLVKSKALLPDSAIDETSPLLRRSILRGRSTGRYLAATCLLRFGSI